MNSISSDEKTALAVAGSGEFYSRHSERYAEVAHQFLQSVYIDASTPSLKSDLDLQHRLKELAPGKRGLDAGCGAGARDVHAFFAEGYDIFGIDAVPENIETAVKWHPEIEDRIDVHDLRRPLPFTDASFDFVMCNAVIQHIEPEDVHGTVLPELVRVIRDGGVFQLMFKNGSGVDSIYDKDYGVDRCFRLYEEDEILETLEALGMKLVEPEEERMGGVMWYIDPKFSRHIVMFVRKEETEFN